MTHANTTQLYTLGELARRLNVPANRLDYAIRRYGIEPATRAGILRLFSEEQIEQIASAVRRCASRPAPGRCTDAR